MGAPLDPTLLEIAARFGVDPTLIAAVEQAEGNLLKAVQCSIHSVQTREKALDVTCRSAVHAMTDFIKSDPMTRGDFVRFWGQRWAPVGATNDPTGLNGNWTRNVNQLWTV